MSHVLVCALKQASEQIGIWTGKGCGLRGAYIQRIGGPTLADPIYVPMIILQRASDTMMAAMTIKTNDEYRNQSHEVCSNWDFYIILVGCCCDVAERLSRP
jgi:hypothetical protein